MQEIWLLFEERMCKCPVILGSATPSLGTMDNAHNEKFGLLRITKRATPDPFLRSNLSICEEPPR